MRAALAIALLLAGCSTSAPTSEIKELANPSVDALMAMSVPEYYATTTLARRIADGCPSFDVDDRLDFELATARDRTGRGSSAVFTQRGAIDQETAAATARFDRKHVGTLCSAGRVEIAERTPIGTLLLGR